MLSADGMKRVEHKTIRSVYALYGHTFESAIDYCLTSEAWCWMLHTSCAGRSHPLRKYVKLHQAWTASKLCVMKQEGRRTVRSVVT